MAHLIVSLTAFWSRDEYTENCLPKFHTRTQFEDQKYELTVGFALCIAQIVLELITFLGGVSLFWPFVSFISILAHCCGSICMGTVRVKREYSMIKPLMQLIYQNKDYNYKAPLIVIQ